jgi:hypothetical protein
MPEISGTTLRAWRRSRSWDVPEMARQLRCAARDTGQAVAAHEGLVRMIRSWERGDHELTERYELLYAAVLGVSLRELAALSSQPRDEASQSDDAPGVQLPMSATIAGLCSVLTSYGFTHREHASEPGTIRSLAELDRDLGISYSACQQSRYTAATSRISALLADTQITLRQCDDAERTGLLRVLALSHQLAASLLSKARQPGTSWIAAERGLAAADSSGIPDIRCSLIRSVAFALLSSGHLEPAIRLVESGADSLRREVTGDAPGLSVYGTLFLAGSMAAARYGDGQKTADFLREAHNAAGRLGRDANYHWTAFGPTNVAIHRVNTAVELGDIQTVLDHGMSLNTHAVPAERRVRYLLDVARTHSLTGNQEDALGTLLAAERVAPEQARQHYLTRKVIRTLMTGTKGRPSVQLGKLAARAGLQVPA